MQAHCHWITWSRVYVPSSTRRIVQYVNIIVTHGSVAFRPAPKKLPVAHLVLEQMIPSHELFSEWRWHYPRRSQACRYSTQLENRYPFVGFCAKRQLTKYSSLIGKVQYKACHLGAPQRGFVAWRFDSASKAKQHQRLAGEAMTACMALAFDDFS